MKVLVTGGTGFLGEYLVRELLSHHYEVILLVRNPETNPFCNHQNVVSLEGDILDIMALELAVQEADYVIHAAAMVSFQASSYAKMNQINVEGTANLVNVCLEGGVKKLIFISSIAALGRTVGQEQITENTKWVNSPLNSRYANSKRKAELEVFRGKEEGLEVAILCPGVILGAGDWDRSSGKIFKIIHQGLLFYNRGINGYVGAPDVAKAARLMIESPIKNGERFILVADSLSQKTLFTLIANSMKKKPPRWELPPFLAYIAGFAFEMWGKITGKNPLISRETVRTSLHQHYYDGSKIVRELDFQYTPLAQVIEEAGADYLVKQQKLLT